ncbi:LCP family protein [Paenibacillus arenosi]|uniref:LCP family protein n=1 Tax=Paenibacillus arenosi TaxID=2774142 RepID=A0ABR9AW52_9BACL|nr:LCP family protein [Paenibacillus arenosi]MBD8498318.1 LCP family protein [Paenibacillus arenosi]
MLQIWRRWRTWQKIAVSCCLFILIGSCIAALIIGMTLKHAADSMYEELPDRKELLRSTIEPLETDLINPVHNRKTNSSTSVPIMEPVTKDSQPDVGKSEPFTMLLMGVDERAHDSGRSDSLIMVAVNPKQGSAVIVHIPRDTRTELAGLKRLDKINHAYAYGGTAMTVATVEQLFEIPIHYYIKTNMEGFKAVIDELGGIEVHNPIPFETDGHRFAVGDIELSGEQSLAYVRMRKQDPKGDFGRMDRQSLVLRALAQRAASTDGVVRLGAIIDVLQQHTRTNLAFEDWISLAAMHASSVNLIEKTTLTGASERIAGIYYWKVSKKERLRIHNLLRNNLDPNLDK